MSAIVMPTLSIAVPWGEVTVDVELATTREEIARGLMYRTHLPYNTGMLFIMGKDDVWSFYMRNTLIPLDMIFIAHDWTIAGIVANTVPYSEELRGVDRPSSYVLEVNGGWAAAHQLAPGASVRPGQRFQPGP